MDNSIHLPSIFSVWKQRVEIRVLGGNKMLTKETRKNIAYFRLPLAGERTGRLARLVSLVKKLDGRNSASFDKARLEKEIHYARAVEIGTLTRYR